MAQERKIGRFRRDAKNVNDSEAVVLIGVQGTNKLGVNCGACGYASCDEFEKAEKRAGQDFTGQRVSSRRWISESRWVRR